MTAACRDDGWRNDHGLIKCASCGHILPVRDLDDAHEAQRRHALGLADGRELDAAAKALYDRTAADQSTHDEAVIPWRSLRHELRARWIDYARSALDAAHAAR